MYGMDKAVTKKISINPLGCFLFFFTYAYHQNDEICCFWEPARPIGMNFGCGSSENFWKTVLWRG